jgi:protein associated with RNAse G/E
MEALAGKKVIIHSYKHDKSLHRIWKNATILEENDEFFIVANKRTKVVESTGRFWYTKEPSVAFFFKNHWYNVIAIIKGQNVNYYCNVGSPVLIDEEALKYIDYDLDLKVESDFTYRILDINEYKMHRELMNYPEDIKNILAKEMLNLKSRIDNRGIPFNSDYVLSWYNKFLSLKG